MKKLLALLTAFGLILSACSVAPPEQSVGEPSASSLQSAEPSSSPSPASVVGLIGEDELFLEGAEAAAKELGMQTKRYSGANAVETALLEGVLALAVIAEDTAAASKAGDTPCFIYLTKGQASAGSAAYDAAKEAELALKTALEFPPHDTPVRLFGLFAAEGSAAAAAYSAAKGEGKVFDKGAYYQNAEQAAQAWVAEKLAKYPAGSLDGIYAETEELALAAGAALAQAGRDDIEVFAMGISAEYVAQMEKTPRVLAAAVGENRYYAGTYTLAAALEGSRASVAIPASVIFAADLKEGRAGLLTEELKSAVPLP